MGQSNQGGRWLQPQENRENPGTRWWTVVCQLSKPRGRQGISPLRSGICFLTLSVATGGWLVGTWMFWPARLKDLRKEPHWSMYWIAHSQQSKAGQRWVNKGPGRGSREHQGLSQWRPKSSQFLLTLCRVCWLSEVKLQGSHLPSGRSPQWSFWMPLGPSAALERTDSIAWLVKLGPARVQVAVFWKAKKRTCFPTDYFKQVIDMTNLVWNTPTI